MAVKKDKIRVATYIKKDLKNQAEEVAKNQGRSLSNYIEQLIRKDVELENGKA